MSVGFLSRVALRDSRIFARLAIGAPSSRLLSSLAKRSDCNTRLSLLTAVATRGLHTSMPGLKEIVFKLTDVGEGIAEVEVLKWFVNEGDKVKQFDKLCEVQSDKANVEITSRFDGRITKLHHAKGEMAKVGHPLVSLDDEADSLSAKDQVAQETFTSPSPSSLSSQSSSTIGSVARKIIPYKLTDVGEGIAEVEVLKWFVKEGDAIKQFDKLCEVQSDKANVEITSRFDGRVARLHYQTGQMAKVGQPLVDIESEEAAPQPVQSHQSNQSHQSYQQSPVKSFAASSSNQANMSNRTLATPAVRRLAREYKLDISKIQATGKDGRVTKGDILNFVSNPSAVAAAQQTPAKAQPAAPVFSAPSHAAPIPSQPIVQTPAPVPAAKPIASEKDQVVPVRGLMRTMIKTMTESLQIPALGYSDEIIMNELIKLRTDLKPVAESKGVKITYMPFLIKAVSMAITQYPIMNSSLSRDMNEITIKAAHNIGVAMDTPAGLLVPNIKNVQSKSILEIAQELNHLQNLGKQGKLSTNELTGGTLTISNIGNIGGTYLKPVILPPEAAIVAFGSVQKLPRYNAKDEIVPHHIMTASWSADHRVVDGATMARFSNIVKNLLENPSKMLLELR